MNSILMERLFLNPGVGISGIARCILDSRLDSRVVSARFRKLFSLVWVVLRGKRVHSRECQGSSSSIPHPLVPGFGVGTTETGTSPLQFVFSCIFVTQAGKSEIALYERQSLSFEVCTDAFLGRRSDATDIGPQPRVPFSLPLCFRAFVLMSKGLLTSSSSMMLARVLVVAACAFFILGGMPANAQNGTWNNVIGGSWSTPGNWAGGVVADGAGSIADFSTLNITAGRTITLDSPRTIGTILFGDATTPDSDWLLNGSALTLSGNPTINVANRMLTISLSLAGTEGLTKLGSGTNVLSTANSYSGGTTISAGTLRISSDAQLGMAPASPTPAHLVIDGGTLSATAVMAINPNRGMALGPAVGTGGGTIEVIPVQAISVTNNGVIANHGAGTGFLAKTGAGRLVLNG